MKDSDKQHFAWDSMSETTEEYPVVESTSVLLQYNYLNISNLYSIILQLHDISEGNTVLFYSTTLIWQWSCN